MTDNEIIKALKYCFTRGFDESTCYECPFYTATAKCTEDLRDSALDLINRQAAEIESLKHRKTELQIRNQELQHEKSEAIKEFAERLKEKVSRGFWDELAYVDVDDIDNLVKEMTEVQE